MELNWNYHVWKVADKTQIKAPPVGSEGSGYFLEQYPINIIYSVDKSCTLV